MLGQVGVDSGVLVGWAGVDVGEAAAGGEAGDGDLGVLSGAGAGGEVGGAGGGEVGAGRWEVGVEDFAFAEAAWKIVLAGSQSCDFVGGNVPSSLPSSVLRAATPESPEATMTETPCIPSFINSEHWRCW